MLTKNGKALTAKGIKPICLFQHVFKSTYVFGAFSPYNGDSLVMELPNCNAENFTHIFILNFGFRDCFAVQIFLDERSKKEPCQYKVIILDNGAFHKAKHLQIPENIGLIFLPPYSPELNPADLVWLNMKRKTTNKSYKTMEILKLKIDEIVDELITSDFVKSLCGFRYFFN